jgi:hypothetical protein
MKTMKMMSKSGRNSFLLRAYQGAFLGSMLLLWLAWISGSSSLSILLSDQRPRDVRSGNCSATF